ncbi:hypothetical protein M513_09524 [Trichuris suis]|uniref:Uncharacterized protein n=1 Tax=Trichuris suis TaxID=68888 RepID=A0A085LX85_9BILA|nr:hypothetical protein M513_09524 [Trichuris suis]
MPVRLDTGESMNCDSNNAIFVDELQESRLDEGKCFEDFEQALEALAVQAEFEQYYEDVINMVTQTLSGDPESGQTEEIEDGSCEEMVNSIDKVSDDDQISGQVM